MSNKATQLKVIEGGRRVPFRLSQGDKFGPTPWLEVLPLGCHFIAQTRKGFQQFLEEYTIKGKQDGCTLLLQHRRTGNLDQSEWQWVDNEEFSNENDLRKVL